MANLGLRGIFGNKQVLFVVGVALLAVFAINYFSSISGAATSNPLVEVVYPNGGEIVSGKIVLKASTSATSPYSEIKESTVQTIQSDGTVYPYYNKAGTGWLLADWPELPDGGMYLETGGFPDGNCQPSDSAPKAEAIGRARFARRNRFLS